MFLFDEPLSHLDAKLRTELRRELKQLHQRLGATMIYVTHDQVEAMTLATRMAVHRHVVVATGCGESSPREQALEAVEFLIARDCDGVVVIGHDLHDEDLMRLHRMHPKMVFLNRAFAQLPQASFCAHHHRGGELAARTLLEHGHREIAVIAGPSSAPRAGAHAPLRSVCSCRTRASSSRRVSSSSCKTASRSTGVVSSSTRPVSFTSPCRAPPSNSAQISLP